MSSAALATANSKRGACSGKPVVSVPAGFVACALSCITTKSASTISSVGFVCVLISIQTVVV